MLKIKSGAQKRALDFFVMAVYNHKKRPGGDLIERKEQQQKKKLR